MNATARDLTKQSCLLAALSDNRHAVETLLNYAALPAPTMIPRHDAVFVMVSDLDDLGEWLQYLGGQIHRSPAFEGVEQWVLHTQTEPRADGSTVAVRVFAPALADESVMPYIRAAVAA